MTTVEEVIRRLESLEKRVETLETGVRQPDSNARPAGRTKKSSAKEFLMGKKASSDPQKALVLAYYLERNEGLESFNITDLEGAFRSAREKVPGNVNDVVNKNIARGFVMDAAERKDSKKAWCLTATGERYVEEAMTK